MYRIIMLFCLGTGLLACATRETKRADIGSLSRESPTPTSPAPSPSPQPHINREELTLPNGVRIVRREIKLENKRWRYKIDVAYPEIEGLPDKRGEVLNRHIKNLVAKAYSWPMLRETKKDLPHNEQWEGVFNSVDMEYDVVEANDDVLSIYFIGYHYGIGAAHSAHESFTINYERRTRRVLTLASLFKSRAQYLKLLSQKCIEELSKDRPYLKTDPAFARNLKPTTENFASWNLTRQGIRINFDACKVTGCADGDLQVEIPFDQLGEISKPGGVVSNLSN